jgi:hypothetical protein
MSPTLLSEIGERGLIIFDSGQYYIVKEADWRALPEHAIDPKHDIGTEAQWLLSRRKEGVIDHHHARSCRNRRKSRIRTKAARGAGKKG